MRNIMSPNVQALGGSATLVKNDTPFVALPHFAVEYKIWDQSLKQAELQAGYHGAAMVYTRNHALHYMRQSDPPLHAAILTAATDGRRWDVYAHYACDDEVTKQKVYFQVSRSVHNCLHGILHNDPAPCPETSVFTLPSVQCGFP